MDKLTQLIDEHLKFKNNHSENPPWIIKNSSVSGRGLFASRDIQPGEVVFKDNTLIIGPRAILTCPTICVSCYEKTNLHTCSRKCGLPVCSKKCENSDVHKKECEIICRWKNGHDFSEINTKLLKCLTPVRSLLLSEDQKELLDCLKSHAGPQHGYEIDILKEQLKLGFTEREEELMRLTCTVLDANSFEVVVGNEEGQSSLRGLYPLSSLMNHTCVPNTMHNFDSNQNMIVKATKFIPEGEEIFHSYTRLIWGTSVRRSHLARTKHFFCRCHRCEDPTEFGTNLSAINCLKCNSFALPLFGQKPKMMWKCISCNEVLPTKRAGMIVSVLGSRLNNLNSLESEPDEVLTFLEKLPKYVPSCSQIAVELKYKLVWMLGCSSKHPWCELSEDLLNEKESICRELLQLLTTLGAGQSKMRGLLLYELYCCLKERQRRFQLQEAGDHKSDFEEESKEMERLFQESRIILKEDVHAPLEIKNYNVVGSQTTLYNGHVFAA